MKKNNFANAMLIIGALLSVFCSFILGNMILGVLVFVVFAGLVVYKQRAEFLASSAETAYKKGQIEKSFGLYEKAIKLKGCPNMGKILYAYRLISEGQESKAKDILEDLKDETLTANERFNYNATHALCIWKQGKLHRAIEIYEALLNEKQSMRIYETLGYLHLCTTNAKKAIAFNRRAFELYPTDERIKSNLATSYYHAGDYDQAARIYKELIEDYANFPDPYYYYGLLLETRKKYKGAIKYWNIALEKKFSHLYMLTVEDIQHKIDETLSAVEVTQ